MQTEKRKRIAFYFFYGGLLLLVASLPLSKFAISVSQFLIAGGWLLDGDLAHKFRRFFTSKLALLVASVYILHLAGLLYTDDFEYAFKDLRIKLPLLILPLLFSTAPPVNKKQFEGILFALITGVVISTVTGWMIYVGIIDRPYNDIRDISIFISHIRLALLCCLSLFAAAWLIWNHRFRQGRWYAFVLIPVITWLLYFLVLIESLTGLIILIAGSIAVANMMAFRYGNKLTQLAVVFISILTPVLMYLYVSSLNKTFTVRQEAVNSKLDKFTPSGHPYEHFPERKEYENGYPIWTYLCEKELEQEWNQRSEMNYSGLDQRNQELRITLIRFMTSKGLRKDSAGLWMLTADEIKTIESGIANVEYSEKGNLRSRIHQVLWELHNYEQTGNPSGHSVAQRLEFWKASIGIIRNNFWFGVGTGDVPGAFKTQYEIMNTRLTPEWRLRAHNQFLSIAVAFGVVGLAWFVIALLYPLAWKSGQNDFLYISFSIISVLSMMTEDTLETQAGVTFFALFNSLFLFINPNYKSTGGK